MYEVTRNFIKYDDITIENIRNKLNEVTNVIKASNKMNLTDINVICEEIFGKILNEIYDINLKSMSVEVSGNYMAVDLVDFDKKIAFQITSRSDRGKIEETIRKFNQSNLPDKIDSLNIMMLDEVNVNKYRKPHMRSLVNGQKFLFKENIFDNMKIVDLIEERNHKENGFIVKMYDIINMVFDSGRVDRSNIVQNTELLTNDSSYDFDEVITWKLGYGDIQLTAFIPLTYKNKLSCLLEIRKYNLAGAYITFDEETLLKYYFLDENEFVRKHNVGRYVYEDTMCMQIENIRLNINAHSAYHIYQLFVELYKKYNAAQLKIDDILGVGAMRKVDDSYLMRLISEYQWAEILYYARNHNWFSDKGDLKRNIFNDSCCNDRLILSPNVHGEIRGDILAEINAKYSEENGMLDLYWKPGFKYDKRSMDGFDNITKWKADFTLEWVNNELLPNSHQYFEEKKKQKTPLNRLFYKI